MGVLIYLYIGVLFLIIVSLFIWLIIVIYKKQYILENDPIVLNFLSHKSNGFAVGLEKEVVHGKNDRLVCRIQSKDFDVKNEIPKDEKVIVEKNKVIQFAKGSLSKFRDIKIYLPKNPEDLPESFKETSFGKFFMRYIELKNVISEETRVVREGSNRKTAILEKLGDGEISEELIKTWEGAMKDIVKSLAKEELRAVKRSHFMTDLHTPT